MADPIKRHKPKSTVRDKMDPAERKDYEKMASACVQAIIAGQDNVFLSFPYFVKFKSKGFPRGQVVEKTATANVHKINAIRLLDWLYAHGFSQWDYKAVKAASYKFKLKLTSIERKLDLEDYLCDNLVSINTEKEST